MDIEAKKQEIETCYKDACQKAIELNQALSKMRSVELPPFQNDEEMKTVMELANEQNGRTAYLLRSLLVQHGNVLFI